MKETLNGEKFMQVTTEQVESLRQHGFMWYKNQSTDRVNPEWIESILPIDNGFAVIYREGGVISVSCATIKKIEIPADPATQWIMVHWVKIKDFYRPGKTPERALMEVGGE